MSHAHALSKAGFAAGIRAAAYPAGRRWRGPKWPSSTVMKGSMHEPEAEALAFRAQLRSVESVDMQVHFVLQIVNRGHPMFDLEPLQIPQARIFADQQMAGDLAHRGTGKAATGCPRGVVRALRPPVHRRIVSRGRK